MGNAFGRGPDHLLWALVDGIVDSYFPCLDQIGDEVDRLPARLRERVRVARVERLAGPRDADAGPHGSRA